MGDPCVIFCLPQGAGSCEGVSDVEEGMLCCGWYDDRWYRVEITRVLSDEEVSQQQIPQHAPCLLTKNFLEARMTSARLEHVFSMHSIQ